MTRHEILRYVELSFILGSFAAMFAGEPVVGVVLICTVFLGMRMRGEE